MLFYRPREATRAHFSKTRKNWDGTEPLHPLFRKRAFTDREPPVPYTCTTGEGWFIGAHGKEKDERALVQRRGVWSHPACSEYCHEPATSAHNSTMTSCMTSDVPFGSVRNATWNAM